MGKLRRSRKTDKFEEISELQKRKCATTINNRKSQDKDAMTGKGCTQTCQDSSAKQTRSTTTTTTVGGNLCFQYYSGYSVWTPLPIEHQHKTNHLHQLLHPLQDLQPAQPITISPGGNKAITATVMEIVNQIYYHYSLPGHSSSPESSPEV